MTIVQTKETSQLDLKEKYLMAPTTRSQMMILWISNFKKRSKPKLIMQKKNSLRIQQTTITHSKSNLKVTLPLKKSYKMTAWIKKQTHPIRSQTQVKRKILKRRSPHNCSQKLKSQKRTVLRSQHRLPPKDLRHRKKVVRTNLWKILVQIQHWMKARKSMRRKKRRALLLRSPKL